MIFSCIELQYIGQYQNCLDGDCLTLILKEKNTFVAKVDNHILGKVEFEGKYEIDSDTLKLLSIIDSIRPEVLYEERYEKDNTNKRIYIFDKGDNQPVYGVHINVNDSIDLFSSIDGIVELSESLIIKKIRVSFLGMKTSSYLIRGDSTNQLHIGIPSLGRNAIESIKNKWLFSKTKRKLIAVESDDKGFFLKRKDGL